MFIAYEDNEYPLEAFVASPSQEEKRPLVILCHAWTGRDEFIGAKAEEIAKRGYVGFALDMYGKGVLGRSKEENASLKRPFVEDPAFLRRRVLRGYEVACSLPYVDKDQVAVLGFGFGGLCALDLARSGVPLKGAASIYGHFNPPPKELMSRVQSKILVLHGHDDPIVTQEDLRMFEKEMSEQNVDWQAHVFGGAGHAFASPGTNFQPIAAMRAWNLAVQFLNELFSS